MRYNDTLQVMTTCDYCDLNIIVPNTVPSDLPVKVECPNCGCIQEVEK